MRHVLTYLNEALYNPLTLIFTCQSKIQKKVKNNSDLRTLIKQQEVTMNTYISMYYVCSLVMSPSWNFPARAEPS